MKKVKAAAAIAVFLAASILTGCSPRSSMSTLSVEADSEASSIFSLTKVLDLGTNYLVSLDYENAILQYIDIIEHDPKNKEAYAGLYAAYAALGKTEEANDIFNQAQEEFKDDADFLPQFLDDAKLVYQSGGGSDPFRMLSGYYWDDPNSIYAEDVGMAWLEAEPDSADPYALLCAHYAGTEDEDKLNALLADAEENGISTDAINMAVESNSNGGYTLTLQFDDSSTDSKNGSDKNGKNTVKVEVNPGDDAKTVTGEIAGKVADNAASKVVQDSGLTGEAADIANSMAQEALRKGLSAAGTAPKSSASSSSTAASSKAQSQATTQGSGSDDFDWSEVEKEMQELDPDFSF